MSEIKLFPCPFCGGEAEIREVDYDPEWHPTYNDPDSGGDAPVYVIICKSCEASIKYKYKESEAVQAWNNRKPIEDMVESVKVENRRFLKEMYHLHGNNYETMIAKKHNDKVIEIVRGERE